MRWGGITPENCEKAAIKLFEKWLSDYPNYTIEVPQDSHALFFIGRMYERMNNFDKAIEFYIKAVEADLDYSSDIAGCAFWAIGKIYEKLENFDKACEYYNKGIKIFIALKKEFFVLQEYFLFIVKHKYNDLLDEAEKIFAKSYERVISEKPQSQYWVYRINTILAIISKTKGKQKQYSYYKNCACVIRDKYRTEFGFTEKELDELMK